MKREDYGFDPETDRHSQRLTRAEEAFLGILWIDHVGEENRITANNLATAFACRLGFAPPSIEDLEDYVDGWKRGVRRMQNHLLFMHDNIPLYSKSGAGGGYWIAESEEEGLRFNDTFRKRAMTGMKKASRGKKAVMVEMVQQLSFEFDGFKDETGLPAFARGAHRPMPIVVVDALFEKMAREPERFSDDLQRLGRKYGSVLLPRARMDQIGSAVKNLQALVEGII